MFDVINPGYEPVAKDFTLPIPRRPGAGSGYCTTRRECALPPQGSRGTAMNCSSEEPGGSAAADRSHRAVLSLRGQLRSLGRHALGSVLAGLAVLAIGAPEQANAQTPNTPATGAPTISGTLHVGRTQTASPGTIADDDGLTNASYSYQWILVDGTDEEDISGATGAIYILNAAAVGKKIKVRASFTDDAGNAESRTSAPTATVEYGAPPTLGVLAGVGQGVLWWTHAVAGLVVTHYEYRSSPGAVIAPDAMWQQVQTRGGGPSSYYQVVKGLTSGTTHTFQVRAAAADAKGAAATVTATPLSQPSCTIDDLGDRRLLWQGQLTAGVRQIGTDGSIETGYGNGGIETGTLTPDAFAFRSTSYSVYPRTYEDLLNIVLLDEDMNFWYPQDEVVDALRLHVCNTPYDFSSAATPGGFDEFSGYQWSVVGSNWPPGIERTLRLSLPANNVATGDPAITGTAQAGQELSADASPIMDADGLTGVDFTYQWLRVDADGTSNPVDISDATAATYTLTDDDEGKKVKVKVSFTDELSGEEERTSAAYPSSSTVTAAGPNTAPTAAHKTVTTGEDRAYAFTADDFGFLDTDTGDTLASVKIVTVPALGTLTFDRTGTAVTANDVVTKAQIDGDNMLTFTPARDAHGAPYTTFTFKVNDGTVDSADAYTMTIDVTDAPAPVCTAPSYGDRREIWTGTVTVAALETDGIVTSYGFDEVRSAGTLLPSQSFSIGSNDYMIEALEVSLAGIMFFSLDGLEQLTDREDVALRLHVCDGDYDFNTAGERFDVTTTTWLTTLDWSDPVVTRTVYLSLPANTAATGEPAITGTARAEQVLTADASPIMDTDGLPSSFTYQWVRVDADGTSNPVDITDANAETYTLTAADVVKKVKVKVSFTDELSGEEERTSAAYPSSGTVTVAGPNTAPTAANNTVTTGEDRPYAFDADDFGFADTDTGDTLASVKIVTPPGLGTLALDGTAVLADGVVTTAQIDGDMLTFTPAQDAHGAPYTTFTFTVNDGTDDSAIAYTMTIDVTDAPLPVCGVPDFGTRRNIWTGTVTVGTHTFLGSTLYGYIRSPPVGALDDQTFTIGSNDYTVNRVRVEFGGSNSGTLVFELLAAPGLTTVEVEALRLHVCDTVVYNFSGATTINSSSWAGTLDWSPPVTTRTVYLSLPANNVATGEPAITGTAQAGQELTADASPIMDADGVPSSFTYQWVRVDADGMSNPADITDATAATYTLTAADAGKKVKVKVSFTDELSGEEERTSAAYPSSGTVIASANTTAPALLSVTVTSTPRKTTDTYGAREHIEFSMTFDAPVTVTGDPTFDFDLGGPSTASWYAGSGTATLRFSHAVSGGSSGDQDTNGISWAMNAIELNGGTIAGTDNAVTAILTHAAQSNLAGHKVDGRTTAVTPATVTDVVVTSTPMLMASGSTTADTYGFGETIVITVTVSEAVEVVGDPVFRFSLTNPGSAANNPQATYDRTRSIATTIVFTYTVQAGDMDNNGIWIGTHSQTFSLDANDRIRTASQQIDIDRSHLEKGTQGGHKVDGSRGAPTVPPDPTAPTLVSATATTLTVEWTHPGNGGSPLTRNFIEYRVEGTTDWTNWYAGETPVTRAVITNLEAATAYDVRVHSSNAIGNSQWAQSATAFSTLANTAPTAADNTVTTGEDRAYAFTADDFEFDDDDAGDTLASVKIVTSPAAGTLALDGTAVLADGVVTKAQIDADMLTFTPARDAHGVAYTTFTFKVNDGTVDSASAYTMTIDVTDAPAPVCAAPNFAGEGRRQIWTGTVTVAVIYIPFTTIINGYGYEFPTSDTLGTSVLPSRAFSIGSHNYTITTIAAGISGKAVFTTDSNASALTTAEVDVLRLHLCDESFDFMAFAAKDETTYRWDASLDWSHPVVTRTVHLSLPTNHAATGEPAITGTAQVGQELTADASPIMDANGLPSIFTYQWLRVDADGTSNEEDINGETDATYTLTDDDLGKKVKVKVSFVDILGSNEQRTSAPTDGGGHGVADNTYGDGGGHDRGHLHGGS